MLKVKRFVRQASAFVCAASLLAAPTVNVQAITNAEIEESYDAAYGIYQAMLLIMDGYAGGEVSVQELYDDALYGMTDGLDEYSSYLDDAVYAAFLDSLSESFTGLGIYFGIGETGYPVISEIMSGSPAESGGLRALDTITAINGTPTHGLDSDTVAKLITDAGDVVILSISRGEEILELSITKGVVDTPSVETTSLTELGIANADKSVGYIYMNMVGDGASVEFSAAIAKLKASGATKLILDLRGNGGGYLNEAVDICRQIVPAGVIIHTYDKQAKLVPFNSYLKERPFEKIVVITDGGTASAAEVIASAIRESGAGVTLGQNTYGKGVIQSVYELEPGGVLKLTTQEYYTRNKNKLNGIGVAPDIAVEYAHFLSPFELDGENGADEVVNLKQAMTLLGYGVSESGRIYTEELAAAAKSFQRAQGLDETGYFDTQTTESFNLALYAFYVENDRELEAAYSEALK